MFINTNDKEKIIKHIISPVELEKEIFKSKYNSLEREYVADTFVIFEKEIKTGINTCQNFIK